MGKVHRCCRRVWSKSDEKQLSTRELFFALEAQIILCPFTSESHILTVSNYKVCSNM